MPDRVEMQKDAFLRRTGQLWKLVVAGIVLPLPTAILGWRCLRAIRPDQPTSEWVTCIAVLAAAAVAVVVLMASIRCPSCRLRLVKRLMQAPEGADAIASFMSMRSCPSCGFVPRQE
jgi:uncharacterized membrane protein YcjF (UPF0283 family)